MQAAELDPKHTDLWDAFIDLKQSASVGWSSDPISPDSVLAWCRLHGIPRWRWRTFWAVVHHLDGVARHALKERSNDHHRSAEA